MIHFDCVEMLTESHPHKCKITLFEKINVNGRWTKNPNFAETFDFVDGCADFEQRGRTHKQREAGIWIYYLHAPFKYRDIPSIANVLPKQEPVRRHRRQRIVDYDDWVAEALADDYTL